MQLILLKTEDLEKREKTTTRIIAMVKKRKEAKIGQYGGGGF